MQHWSGLILPSSPDSPWPSKRSFHSACSLVDPDCLPYHTTSPPTSAEKDLLGLPYKTPDLMEGVDPKLVVLWGWDNDCNPVKDCWVLNVNTLSWRKVNITNIPHVNTGIKQIAKWCSCLDYRIS